MGKLGIGPCQEYCLNDALMGLHGDWPAMMRVGYLPPDIFHMRQIPLNVCPSFPTSLVFLNSAKTTDFKSFVMVLCTLPMLSYCSGIINFGCTSLSLFRHFHGNFVFVLASMVLT